MPVAAIVRTQTRTPTRTPTQTPSLQQQWQRPTRIHPWTPLCAALLLALVACALGWPLSPVGAAAAESTTVAVRTAFSPLRWTSSSSSSSPSSVWRSDAAVDAATSAFDPDAAADGVLARPALGAAVGAVASRAQRQAFQLSAATNEPDDEQQHDSAESDAALRRRGMVTAEAAAQIELRLAVTVSSSPLLTRASQQYQIMRAGVRVHVDQWELSTQAVGALERGETDGAVSSLLPKATDLARAPDLHHLPLWAYAFVVVSHVPEAGGLPLLLSVPLVCGIFSGNVTRWDDAELQRLNPSIDLPARPIHVVLAGTVLAFTLQFTQLCASIDPVFSARITPSNAPEWPLGHYARSTTIDPVTGPVSMVSVTPDTVALAYSTHARKLGAAVSPMINAAGAMVQPTLVAITSAMRERSILTTRDEQGRAKHSFSNDLMNAPGATSWPFVAPVMLALPRTFTRTTCRARSELIKFFRWMLDDESIRYTLADKEDSALLPVDVDAHLGLSAALATGVRCSEMEAANIGSAYSILSGGGQIATMHVRAMDMFNRIYTQRTNSQTSVSSVVSDPSRALSDLSDPLVQLDVAWIFPAAFRSIFPGEIEQHVQRNRLRFLPWSVYGIIPIYTLAPSMLTLLRVAEALPLRVTMETLAKIFVGDVRRWDHPELIELNPALGPALASSGADPAITLVLYGQGPELTRPAQSTISNALILALNTTESFLPARSGLPAWSLPPDWRPVTARLAALGVRSEIVATETEMEPTVLRTPGAIGYKLSFSSAPNPDTDFSIVRTVVPRVGDASLPDDALELVGLRTDAEVDIDAAAASLQPYNVTVSPSPASFAWCAHMAPVTRAVDLDLHVAVRNTAPSAAGCWPLPLLVMAVLPADLKTVDQSAEALAAGARTTINLRRLCQRQVAVVQFVDFLLFDSDLLGALAKSGAGPLTGVPWLHDVTRKELDSVKCGGQEILVIPDIIWSLASGLRLFGLVGATIGFILVGVTVALVLKFRQRSIVSTARVPMQLLMLAGLAALFVVPLLFVLDASPSFCHGVSWMAALGFSMTYAPIACKIWRVWVMARRKKHSLRRGRDLVSTPVMYATCAAHVLVDVVLLAVQMDRGGALVPTTVVLMKDSRVHVHTQCGLADNALPIVLTIVCIKLALLVVTSMMAFGARHVSSAFGESAKLSWAVWNTLLSGCIIVVLVALVGEGAGDVHTFLLVFLVLWAAATTLLFAFGRRLVTVVWEEWRSVQEASRISRTSRRSGTASNTSGATGSGLTGSGLNSAILMPSLDAVGLDALEKYMTALESQLRLAKQRYRTEYGTKGNWEKHLTGGSGFSAGPAGDDDTEPPLGSSQGSSFNFRGNEVRSMETLRAPSRSFHQTKLQLVAPAPARPPAAAAVTVAPIIIPPPLLDTTSPPTPGSRSPSHATPGAGAVGGGVGGGPRVHPTSPSPLPRQPLRINTALSGNAGGGGGGGGGNRSSGGRLSGGRLSGGLARSPTGTASPLSPPRGH